MWKVLIADDEPKIRRGLRATVERIRPDMKVVGEAEDGERALALVRGEKPDILMIDVRMPFLNGLDLIQKVNEISRDCIIIVVSGHDEFEYAQRALQLKVFEYVLKPVSDEVLATVFSRAAEELASARKRTQYLGWAREQLERNMPLLREQLLRDWVRGRLSRSEIQEQGSFLGIMTTGYNMIALVHVMERLVAGELPLGASALPQEKDRRIELFAVRRIVEEVFRDFPPVSVFIDEQDDIVALACASPGRAWTAAIETLESRAARSLVHALVITHAPLGEGMDGIAETYEALCAEVARRSGHRSFVLLAQNYIDTHYGEPELTLEEVAGAVQVSPGYLSRLLKRETGFSFVDYLTRVRINKAVHLMSDPAVKVYEVAEAVGYQSQHYFSRAFKRVFGRSPVEYRKGGA
ncbi:MAG: response regulator [Spirochaetia bacterium]|jgi:two-component system response regulator YesN